ncbi:MAG: SPOR domain-containing protein [Holophagaceae bacterium]|nr:SPOR domain-containing protein [Holophagaceae bacterium]
MPDRDSHFITMSRQSIYVATAMGVGLLTFCYVIGVQVGKKSLTRNNVKVKSLDEQLKELGEPLDQQLKLFESIENSDQSKRNDRSKPETQQNAQAKQATSEPQTPSTVSATLPAVTSTPPQTPISQQTGERYTAQVIASGDRDRAKQISDQLRAQGMPAKIVSADGLFKVQLDWAGTRAELDSRISRLQILGYDAVPVRVQ